MADRSVTVKLAARVSDYVRGMRTAKAATGNLTGEVRQLNRAANLGRLVGLGSAISALTPLAGAAGAAIAGLPAAITATGGVAAAVIPAFRGMGEAMDVAGKDGMELAAALRGLSPSARSIVGELGSLGDELDALGRSLQERFWSQMTGDFRDLAVSVMPTLQRRLGSLSAATGDLASDFLRFVSEARRVEQLDRILAQTEDTLGDANTLLREGTGLWLDLAEAGGPFVEDLVISVGKLVAGLRDMFDEMRDTGELDRLFASGADSVDLLISALLRLLDALFTVFASPGVSNAVHVLLSAVEGMAGAVQVAAAAFSALPEPIQTVIASLLLFTAVTIPAIRGTLALRASMTATMGSLAQVGTVGAGAASGLSKLSVGLSRFGVIGLAFGAVVGIVGGVVGLFTGSADKAASSVDDLTGEVDGAMASLGPLGTSVSDAQTRFDALTGTLREQIEAGRTLTQVWEALNGANLSAIEAEVRAEEAFASLTETFKENSRSLRANTKEGRENLTAISTLVTAARDLAQAKYQQALATHSEKEALAIAQRTYDSFIGRLVKTMEQAGVTDKQINRLIGDIGRLQPKKHTEVTSTAERERRRVKRLRSAIASLRNKSVTISVFIDEITRGKGGGQSGHYSGPATGLLERHGGVVHAARHGMVTPAHVAVGTRIKWAEPATGGEAFIPRNGRPARSRAIVDEAASWYGGRVDWGGQMSGPMAAGGSVRVTVDLVGRDGAVVQAVRRHVHVKGGGNVQIALGRS